MNEYHASLTSRNVFQETKSQSNMKQNEAGRERFCSINKQWNVNCSSAIIFNCLLICLSALSDFNANINQKLAL